MIGYQKYLERIFGSLISLYIWQSLALQLYSGYRPSDLKMCGLAIQQKIKLSASDKRKVHETKGAVLPSDNYASCEFGYIMDLTSKELQFLCISGTLPDLQDL